MADEEKLPTIVVQGTAERPNNVARSFDKSITEKEEIDVVGILGVLPRKIRILTDQNATLEYKMPLSKDFQTWEEGITANTALEITDEGWEAFRVIPTTTTRLRLYLSGWKPSA